MKIKTSEPFPLTKIEPASEQVERIAHKIQCRLIDALFANDRQSIDKQRHNAQRLWDAIDAMDDPERLWAIMADRLPGMLSGRQPLRWPRKWISLYSAISDGKLQWSKIEPMVVSFLAESTVDDYGWFHDAIMESPYGEDYYRDYC